jgi:hypothetical protein
VCLVACSYTAPADSGDAAIDGPSTVGEDAAVDGPPGSCVVGTTGGSVDRGKVGRSMGGAPNTTLACDEGTVMVGVAIDLSDGLADGVTQSAHGIRIACAPLTIDGSGPQVGGTTTKEVLGNGGSGWTPSTFSPVAMCPAGSVITGMRVFGSSFTSYFLDVSIRCTRLDATGAVVANTVVDVAGSGNDAQNQSLVNCNTGEQVVAMTTRTGAGLDSVNLLCAATACN